MSIRGAGAPCELWLVVKANNFCYSWTSNVADGDVGTFISAGYAVYSSCHHQIESSCPWIHKANVLGKAKCAF